MRGSEASYAFKIDEVIADCQSWEKQYPTNPQLGEVLALLGDAYAASDRETAAIPIYIRSYQTAATDEVMNYSLFAASTADDARSGAPIYEITKRWMFRNADWCLATGPLQAAYVRSYDPRARVAIIGNPVDMSRFATMHPNDGGRRDRLRAARGWSDRFVIGYVGRLSPEKDLRTLIRAAATLTRENMRATVAIVGSGRLESSLRAFSAELGTDVQFIGFLDGLALGDLYRSLDVFCLPSRSEAWGLVVNEAMGMGLPTVVSDRVGSRSLFEDGKSGIIFPAGDVFALAQRLMGLARSVELRTELGAAAQNAVQAQTISAWTAAVVGALRDG